MSCIVWSGIRNILVKTDQTVVFRCYPDGLDSSEIPEIHVHIEIEVSPDVILVFVTT